MTLAVEVFKPNALLKPREGFAKVFELIGQVITRDPISELRRVETTSTCYYVKLYHEAGKYLRRFIGRSRCRRERDNLLFFERLGIPVPALIAFGERHRGLSRQSFLITEELVDTENLLSLYQQGSELLSNRIVVDYLISQVADYTRRMHKHQFVHVDLKWRNVLVNVNTLKAYFIDCPQGHRAWFNLKRGIIKDLACLDKVGRKALSKSVRLRFYKQYSQIDKLNPAHKKRIRRILVFFEGRE